MLVMSQRGSEACKPSTPSRNFDDLRDPGLRQPVIPRKAEQQPAGAAGAGRARGRAEPGVAAVAAGADQAGGAAVAAVAAGHCAGAALAPGPAGADD